MKRYRIMISPEAERDIEEAYLYIKVQSLSTFPLRCPLAPESDLFQLEIRHLIINNYRILYTITEDAVYILHARHGRQEWLTPE